MMKSKWAILSVLGAFLVLAVNSGLGAVNTGEIEEVRNKEVLDPDEDFRIIDDFVAKAVRELVRTRDSASISKARTVILQRVSSNRPSAQAQYAAQFFESAYKYISEAFEQASELPADRKFTVTLNLLILVDHLENLQLADLAIGMLKDENTVIRYWAVHSVTNPAVASNPKLARKIAEQLKGLVASSGPEIIRLMAEFAANVNIPQGEDLLLQIADMRIKRYADWTVEYELLDATILSLLCKKLSSAGVSKPVIARHFGQLYSYAIQRYVKGRNHLSAAQKRQLASVLVEVEDNCVAKLLGRRQSTIKKAVEQGDYEALRLEHSRLLGEEAGAGKLARKLKFDYGKTPNGRSHTAPLLLREPPKTGAGG